MNIKMRYLTIIVVGILLAAYPAVSDDVAGAGTGSCGKYLAAIEGADDGDNLSIVRESMYFSWVQGYLTGLNSRYLLCQELSTDLSDVSAIEFWIKNYCEENPLDQYLMAAAKLWAELRVKQKIQSIYECP